MSQTRLFVGVMSGSSLDGVDVVLTELSNPNRQKTNCKILNTHFQTYPDNVRQSLLSLHLPQENELEQAALMANQLAHLYAEAINNLLLANHVHTSQVTAIGCHGQTVRHKPQHEGNLGYSIQLGNNALLAELTNITVVGDFRSRDIAAHGQGAPLVPAFHQAIFGSSTKNRAVINIGGIANISYLSTSGEVIGFDTGPGNILLDYWTQLKLDKHYDANGAWSSTGTVQHSLLEKLLATPYFAQQPPKSTGRDLFNAAWLAQYTTGSSLSDQDIARTLVELTAITICQDMKRHCPDVDEVYICGGGAHNHLLMDSLKQKLANIPLQKTDSLGVNVDWVEATAFAWLAQQAISNKPANLPSATGASGLRILGAIYPA